MEKKRNEFSIQKNKTYSNNKVLELVQMGLLIAVTCVVTMTMKVPTHIGYTHLGDSMVFLAAILLGKKKGMTAAALGMFLADMLGGYFIWAPITLVIKGIMAFLSALIAYRGNYEGRNIINNIFGCIVGGIWMIAAYYVANAMLLTYVFAKGTTTLKQNFGITFLESVIPNTIEVLIGMAIAIPLAIALKKKIKISK